jgi:hypothetical protein
MVAHWYTDESEYLDNDMAAFKMAVMCEAASAPLCFHAAKSWVHCVDAADSMHESALDAYQAVIELLPILAMFGLDMQSCHEALMSGSGGLASDAAPAPFNQIILERQSSYSRLAAKFFGHRCYNFISSRGHG